MDAEPKRAWWRKKRWIAAGGLLLAACYPLSLGPTMYAAGRGWVGEGTGEGFYAPVVYALNEIEDANRSAEVTVRATMPDGRVVTSRGQALDVETPWWAPAASMIAKPYWNFVTWCGEAGMRQANSG